MWIIKNRVTGEYDSKGLGKPFSKISRSGWDKIGHAKCHVAQKVKPFRLNHNNLEWYLNADFIEIDENGSNEVIPVGAYITYLLDDKFIILSNKERKRLEEYRNAGN